MAHVTGVCSGSQAARGFIAMLASFQWPGAGCGELLNSLRTVLEAGEPSSLVP